MRGVRVMVVLGTISLCSAADLKRLPPNTWVEIKYTTEQPDNPSEKGQFARLGWNKLVYDPDGKRVLFYDRWVNKKHGGGPSTEIASSPSIRRTPSSRQLRLITGRR